MDIAIVGLPQSGKSTTFRALTAGHGSAASDSRGEHIGAVKIPDSRLDRLGALVKAKKLTPIEVTLHDLPPLFSRGAAPPTETMQTLGRADALLHIVRAFRREDVPHTLGRIDPDGDVAAFDAELILNDLAIIERRLDKLDITVRSGKPGEREAGEREQHLLERCAKQLEAEQPLRNHPLDEADAKALANYGLLSLKPMLIVLNIDETEVATAEAIAQDANSRHAAPGTAVAALCAGIEADLAELTPEEAADFRRELGALESGTSQVLAGMQRLLRLITFFTAGEKETRAWSLPAGGNALQAAGRIHTDIERGFIRAEVITWDKLLELGSHTEAKRRGQLRTEGKQYVVQDGDVINVLFSV